MDNELVLVKTAAGVEEIARPGRRVPARLRRVLILVDGRRSVQHLSDAAAVLGDVRAALAALREMELVAPLGGTPHATHPAHLVEPASRASGPGPARSAAANPGRASAPRRSLALARLFLLNTMEQSLRHADQPVRERLRSATTRAELLEVFALCREIAVELGVAHIARIEAQFMGMLPEED